MAARLHVEVDGATHALAGEPGARLDRVLAHAGFPLNTRCGGRGLCRGCEVDIVAGAVAVSGDDVAAPARVRACRAHLCGAASVAIPARSRLEARARVEDSFVIGVPYALRPLFPPADGRDTGFAVDIGTTTVAVLLVDLRDGRPLARAGAFNAQIRHGDNVLTRIDAAREPGARARMQRAVVDETLAPLLREACARAGREPGRLAGGTIAGNTTMLHLFVGEDPASLGVAPFTPRFLEDRSLEAGAVGLRIDGMDPATPLWLLPGIAAYVGADIAAGVLAAGLEFDEAPSLLVDVGTNGEIVLQSGGALRACATAAGPAFEGAGLCCGTRAREGAVSALRLRLDPFGIEASVLGGGPLARAAGICGSAYVDFLATGRACGLLGANGRFVPEAWARVPAAHRSTDADGRRALRLADADGEGGLIVSEVDVALLLQAKAAVGAGIATLLEVAGMTPDRVGTLHLAGGFGMHLDVAHAIAVGLLPGFDPAQVRVVGNTALGGAMLALLDRASVATLRALAARTEVLELNLAPGFEDRYIDHLGLP